MMIIIRFVIDVIVQHHPDHDSSTQGCGSATGVQVYSETKNKIKI